MITWVEDPAVFAYVGESILFRGGCGGVSVCMSMNVWNEKKKEETKNNNYIHSHIHTLTSSHDGCSKVFKNVEDMPQHREAQ